MAVPKIISDVFMAMDDAKEIWAAIKTRFWCQSLFQQASANSQLRSYSSYTIPLPKKQQQLLPGLADEVYGYCHTSNAEVLGYEEDMSRGIFVLRETDAGYYDIPLYNRFKQVEYKGVPHPLSGDYNP
ncbi:hypothetical protein Tco_0111476 [Tanacetum coccineum]